MNQLHPNTVHPVAGCQGISRTDLRAYDHRWFVVDENGQWISASQSSGLSNVTCDVRMGSLILRAPGMLRLDIPMDVIEDDDSVRRQAKVGGQTIDVVDEGDVCATWFSHVTGQSCRLVKLHPESAAVSWPQA